jgi:serine/threonine-protein kinase
MLKKIFCAPMIQIGLMTALILVGMLWPLEPLEQLENRHFDLWAKHFKSPGEQPITILAIDSQSIRRIGDWPWPRSRIADMVRLISENGAKALGVCLLYARPDMSPGLVYIRELKKELAAQEWPDGKQTIQILDKLIDETEGRLNQDRLLIDAVRQAKNAVLPIRFTIADSTVEDDGKPSGLLIINSLRAPALPMENQELLMTSLGAMGGGRMLPLTAGSVRETFGELAGKAGALGHVNLPADTDGRIREVPLLITYKGRLFPALALQLAIKYSGSRLRDLTISQDRFGQSHFALSPLQLYSDSGYRMLLNYNHQWTQARTVPFGDILDGSIEASIFKGQIVLIGLTDLEMVQSYHVGSQGGISDVALTANLLARILSTDRLSRPTWALPLEIVVLLYFTIFLGFVIPRANIRIGVSILIIFLATWYAAAVGLFLAYGYWVKLFGPVILAISGFIIIQLTLYSRNRQQEKMEINKTLGLSYQGQGMLDMAYEKFIQCPVQDVSVRSLLYNLGLDFERKRMFNKALAIYEHIQTDGKFKDIETRIIRLKAMADPLGLTSGTGLGEDTIKDEANAMPTFGRYEIIRTLGRGAMGTIYLGRDPKINRKVAIKTMEYAEVAPEELAEVKARFFREAEAAGKLSHPNIVSIYDAGEEHDMAYIAMELLSGENLSAYCGEESRQPINTILPIIKDVAAALEYAHHNGVVHRDIKPANIMLLKDGRVKVTDFGIARVIDATQTRTGIILGTPSYMSPEQVSGKKVDGRSDLFALGVVFYQLLTGMKPFKGDNLTAIMYAITHAAHTPLSEAVPGIPSCVEVIVDKLLAKGVTKRFRNATQVSEAIAKCQASLNKEKK